MLIFNLSITQCNGTVPTEIAQSGCKDRNKSSTDKVSWNKIMQFADLGAKTQF
jgi:hypothetical protein